MEDDFSSQEDIKKSFDNLYNLLKQKYPAQIEYKGVVSGDSKNRLLWNSDIFILPTYHPSEAFPISIIEAMRAGNYIISTLHNLIPKIVKEDNGTLIEPRSTNTIIQSISFVCSNIMQMREVQNHNIKCAIRNYQENKYIEQILSIIDS